MYKATVEIIILLKVNSEDFFSTFLNDEILPHLNSANDRISRMEKEIPKNSKDLDFYNIRIEKLKRLTKASGRLLPALARLLKL